MKRRCLHFLWIGAMLLAMPACQLSSPSIGGELNEAVTEAPVASSDPQETQVFQYATELPDVKLKWFRQEDYDPKFVRYCIMVTSRDASLVQFSSSFRITAYDASGNNLGETTEFAGWVYPGQSLPIAGGLYLTTDGKVDRLEVKADGPGQLAPPPGKKETILSVENAGIILLNQTAYAVGTLHNSFDKALTNVRVTALAYDAGDKLIDAEYDDLSFVSAGQQTAVQIELRVSSEAAKVELYPCLGNNAEFLDAQSPALTVEKAGALQRVEGQIEAIFVVRSNAARAYAGSFYNISLYDADGKALAAANAELPFISPDSRVVQIAYIPYPLGAKIARMDVQVQPRPDNDWANQEAAAITVQNPLTLEQVQYQPDPGRFDDKVTMLAKNGSEQAVDSMGVAAVLYNTEGQIVGGGTTTTGILPVGSQTQLEVRVNVDGQVDQVEVIPFYYNTPSNPGEASVPPASPGDAQETPAPRAEAPRILSQWFAHSSGNHAVVDFAFLVENPNPELELLDPEYQVVLYDQAGTVLGSTTGRINRLPAGGRYGVVGVTTVKDTDTVSRIETTITDSGNPQVPANSEPLQLGSANYADYQEWDIVSGVVSNSLPQDIPDVTVNALAFDAAGEIVGAGRTFGEYFIPGNGQAPVAVRVETTGTAARAELYLDFQLYQMNEPASAGLQPLKVIAAGFSQAPDDPKYVVTAFTVENPNPGQMIFDTGYQVSLYDQAGVLLATKSDSGLDIHPGMGAIVTDMNVPRETQVAKVQVLLGTGQGKDAGPNPLQGDKATYIAKPYPEVTGLILNTSSTEVKGFNVCAILYDQEGHIIGGGSSSFSNVPANGQRAVEIMVHSSGEPARVELYVFPE